MEKIRKDKKLTFSIPDNKEGEKDSKYSIRKIVEATSNNKTDFMYSVILSENEEKMLPDYIKERIIMADEIKKNNKHLINAPAGSGKKIFKITEIEGILTAYKLFYVGCSRARKNLIIMVEKIKL